MRRKFLSLDFDTARDADPINAWATITVLVIATLLSVQEFMGADFDFLVTDWRGMPGNSWTFITSCFLHIGWMHLIFNLYWTFKFGVLLEAMLGLVPFTLVVLGLAAGSSAAQWGLDGPGVGLSGIGYGLFGLLFALDRWHHACRGVLDKKVAELFGAWFLICIALDYFDIMGIANVAHGAGFLLGAALGWTVSPQESRALFRYAPLPLLLIMVALTLLSPVRLVLNRSTAYAYELFDRGIEDLVAERWQPAADNYEQVLARISESPEAWHNLAIAYAELGLIIESEDARKRSLQLKAERKRAEREASSGGEN